jgi:hypothetical protein
MMAFVVMVMKQIFDPTKLLIATGKLYKSQSVVEIFDMMGSEPSKGVLKLMNRFLTAYKKLVESEQSARSSVITTKTQREVAYHSKGVARWIEKGSAIFDRRHQDDIMARIQNV